MKKINKNIILNHRTNQINYNVQTDTLCQDSKN